MKPHDSPTDLEQQLQWLRPRDASMHLRQRIADQIDAPLVPARWYAPLALAASLAISAMLIALLMLPTSKLPQKTPPLAGALPSIDSTLPSFMAYRQALSESESALTNLLDEHARTHQEMVRKIDRASPAILQMHPKLPL